MKKEIHCGIDLIGISIADGIAGFKVFLEANSGSYGHEIEKTDWQTIFTFSINGFLFDGTYNKGSKRLSIKVGALRQYSDTSKAYKRWLFLQQLYHHYGKTLTINEIHFAVDIPYYYADITIKPESCVHTPSFKSTLYFDSRRGQGKPPKKGRDDFVIYDKCRKCRIGVPLTRIELRLTSNLNPLLYDDLLQQKVASRISRKFNEIHIHKGRSKLNLSQCDWYRVLSHANSYIKGNSSRYQVIAGHRNNDIEHSGVVFKTFMDYCRKNQIYTAKPQQQLKAKRFLSDLAAEDKIMLNKTIAAYNRYDSQWYKDTRFEMGNSKPSRIRLTDDIKERILFSVQQGQTQVSIANELGVSESTISRWLYGYVQLTDTKYLRLISI